MDGPEHYLEAEKLLETGTNMTGRPDEIQSVLAAAQVHATLAGVAAIIDATEVATHAYWRSVISP